jgi:hypothetical protein
MAGKIFISYRRDDDPSAAARVRDALAARLGKASLFMDVDSLFAGQRFDEELNKALATCEVLIVVMGRRWLQHLNSRLATRERDYVREEIAGALRRRIVIIPALVGREGRLPQMPRPDQLPDDIRDLVSYQKHDVVHEHFGRDIAALIDAIVRVRKAQGTGRAPYALIGATAAIVLTLSSLFYASAYNNQQAAIPPPPRPSPPIAAPSYGDGIVGVWIDHTGVGGVEISECGANLCGRIVWLQVPNKNLCGVQIIGNVKSVGKDTWDGGWIYDPGRDARYSVELKSVGTDRLSVTGYMGSKQLISETMIWTRAPADLARC